MKFLLNFKFVITYSSSVYMLFKPKNFRRRLLRIYADFTKTLEHTEKILQFSLSLSTPLGVFFLKKFVVDFER